MKSLYNISAEQLRLNDMLEESGGEITPELEEALRINAGEFDTRAEAYCVSAQRYDDLEAAITTEIARLQSLKKTAANISARLKSQVLAAMECFGISRAEVGLRRISTRRSTSVTIDNAAALPGTFIKVTTAPNKVAIAEALKRGEDVPGARLTTKKTLQIR